MKINMVIGGLFLLLISLIVASPVLAGGAMFSSSVDSEGWANDSGFGRIIRVYIHPDILCKGTSITFKFSEPKDGDYIMTGSGNSTFVMQEDRNGNDCSTYAKMASKNAGERKIQVETQNLTVDENGSIKHLMGQTSEIRVDFDGQYHGDNHYDGYAYDSYIRNPYDNSFYNRDSATPTPMPYSAPIVYPTTTVNYQIPTPTIIYTAPVVDDQKTEELNKKITDLQKQLDQSQKKQSALEIKLNQIMNWIKSVFPFFK